jgi:hypothetical protein
MANYRYTGRAYRQALDESAPWLLSFIAPAEELMEWAGVPRRSEQNQAGFQRLEDQSRVDRAKEFFQQPVNQSPTSIILGLHGRQSDGIKAELTFLDDDDDTGGSRPCIVEVSYEQPSPEQAREIVRQQLRSRLQDGLQASSPAVSDEFDLDQSVDLDGENGILAEATVDEAADLEDNVDVDVDEDEQDDEELELGQSVLADLLRKLDDDEWATDKDNAAAILDLAKPATIIDGQHRLLGADATERGIPFSVVAIADCPWAEQVFQFTVVNYTAKGIPDQFITANAALSLTKNELDTLKTRLVQANVKIKEYDLMRIVNFDSRSPFAGLINLSEGRNSQLIGYKTMVQVANQWFDAKHQVFNTLLPRLYPDVKGKGQKTRRRERWREGDWGEFFLAFWEEVYLAFRSEPAHVAGRHLWDVGNSQLTVAVVLLELQRAFLDNLNAQDEEFFDVESGDLLITLTDKVRLRAKKFVNFFPSNFFSTKWGITSLNTGSGRVDLETCIRQMVDSKGKYQYAADRLITGG